MVKKLKISIDEDRYEKIVGMDVKFQNNNISQTVRELMDKGFDVIETAFLVKDSVDSNLSLMRSDFKNIEKTIQSQSNRIAQIEIRTLVEASTQTNLLKHFVQYGELSEEEIERITKASKRAVFQELNGKKGE